MKLVLRLFLLGAPVFAGIQNLGNGNIPIVRTDAQNIQFSLHSSINASYKNAAGVAIFTPASDPAGAIRQAADAWGSVKTAAVKFAPFQTTSVSTINATDGINLITAADTPENRSLVGSFLAYTTYRFNGQGQITDTDIVINPDNFDTSANKVIPFSTLREANTYDLLGTMTHEFGHALSAAHSPLISATMYQASSFAGSFVTGYESSSQSVISTDDAAFVSAVYPAPGVSLGTITGTVKLDSGTPVLGAIVVAVSSSGTIVTNISSLTDGTYTIPGVPPGAYLVYAQPLNGPVKTGNLSLPGIAKANITFRTTFAGGNDVPASIAVTGGASTNADITPSSLAATMHIDIAGTGSAGGTDWAYASVKAIPDSASRDILLWGPGIDSTLQESQIQLLSGGLKIRAGSLKVFPSAIANGLTPMRFTVDFITAPSVKIPVVIAVSKNGETVASTGEIFVIPAPKFTSDAIVNAASFKGGPVVPGEVITLFGANFGPTAISTLALDTNGRVATTLADTILSFDSTAPTPTLAPIVYSITGQMSAVVPYNVSGKTNVNVRLIYGGAVSTPVQLSVSDTSPALFTLNSSGTGPGAILNQDGSVNQANHPAAQGSVIVLYGTGMGILNPLPKDGEVTFVTETTPKKVTVTIGGKDANVVYAGAAPSLVSGVFQINATLPAGIGSGAIPILVTVGNTTTPAGVTVFVQ
jgi:uncharacterized protein (TIGR03437 family)